MKSLPASDVEEQHRTAALILGAEHASSWRPTDWHLRLIVEAVIACADAGETSTDFIADTLALVDAEWPWCAHMLYLLEAWDDRETRARELGTLLALLGEVEAVADAEHAAIVALDELDSARERADLVLGLLRAS